MSPQYEEPAPADPSTPERPRRTTRPGSRTRIGTPAARVSGHDAALIGEPAATQGGDRRAGVKGALLVRERVLADWIDERKR